MKRFFGYVRPYAGFVVLTFIVKLTAAVSELLIPSVLAKLIDDIVPTGNAALIWKWGIAMLLFSLICVVTNITANFIAARTAGRITRNVRRDLFAKVSSLSARQMDAFTVPSLISRMTSDTYNVSQMAAKMQRLGFRAPVILIGGILLTLFLDPGLTLVLAATLPFISVIILLITRFGIPMYARVQKAGDGLVRCVQENLTGMRVIKALSRSGYERDRFDRINKNLAGLEQKAGLIMNASNPATTLVLNIGLCLIVVAGAFRVNSGATQPGTVIAFLSYFTIILNGMIGITNIFVIYSKGAASAGRISEVLDCGEDMPVLAADTDDRGDHVRFEQVTFSYRRRKEQAGENVSGLSFSLQRGQTLGLIGTTGCGKSTVISLLLRLYDPDSGCVRINGRDIRSMDNRELRARFGMVFQNDFIMAASLRENVAFGRDISDEAILTALHHACADGFLAGLSDGLDHEITAGGTNISGGQRQRILLARALAAHPEILILDDASSALDYRTDADLRRSLHEHYGDCTKLIVAQRISSIMHADLILVMDDGEVIGRGSHSQLMQNCEEYRRIAETQLGGDF